MSTGGGAEHLRRQAEKEARRRPTRSTRRSSRGRPSTTSTRRSTACWPSCELLGDPQKAYRVVHLTGTNGKTSTARMVERLLREHGLRTGRFTSPHLSRVNERIAIDGEPISDERFVEVWQDVAPYVHLVDQRSAEKGEPRLSFFEVFTVMAFAAFADAPVDVAVIEVGLGRHVGLHQRGRRRGRDHHADRAWTTSGTSGDTLVEIASEKSGIIKDGATLVLATQTGGRRGRACSPPPPSGARGWSARASTSRWSTGRSRSAAS